MLTNRLLKEISGDVLVMALGIVIGNLLKIIN